MKRPTLISRCVSEIIQQPVECSWLGRTIVGGEALLGQIVEQHFHDSGRDNASPLFGLSVKIERATAVVDSLTSAKPECFLGMRCGAQNAPCKEEE
jgi:hypothetical protein